MNSVDPTPLAAGGNGRNREPGGFGTWGVGGASSRAKNVNDNAALLGRTHWMAFSVDFGVGQPDQKAEEDKAYCDSHEQIFARLRQCRAADRSCEEHDAVTC